VRALLLSGNIGVGKTSVAKELGQITVAEVVSVRQVLRELLGVAGDDREEFQRRGAELDRRTGGRWLLHYLQETHPQSDLVLDAVRTRRQALPILNEEVDSRLVFLEAGLDIRRQRYRRAALSDRVKASVSFERAMEHPTELEAIEMRGFAHLVLATDVMSVKRVATTILEELSWFPTSGPSLSV
jgi:cytidylate kinase